MAVEPRWRILSIETTAEDVVGGVTQPEDMVILDKKPSRMWTGTIDLGNTEAAIESNERGEKSYLGGHMNCYESI
jgi:hypothetical protein